VPYRPAQQAFKAVVLSTYHGHRAYQAEDPSGAPGGAHKPAADGGENQIDNGLLLRSDVHTLYDGGYLYR
jgi:putative restriction endonuclease